MKISAEKLDNYVKMVNSLPDKKPEIIKVIPTEKCVCKKQVKLDVLEDLNTGVFYIKNDVCKGCKEGKEYDQHNARLVCAFCKRVIMRIPPHATPTGFEFKKNHSYHVQRCAMCSVNNTGKKYQEKVDIIEKVIWDKKNNKK